MNVFEVFFILLFLTSLVIFALAAGLFIFHHRRAAIRLVRIYVICLSVYAAIVLVSSFLASREELRLGEPLCFDDWCITIESVQQTGEDEYVVTGSLSSRARRVPQRETGVALYLTDSSGARYNSVSDSGETAFDTRLLPNEMVSFSRIFQLSSGKTPVGVIVTHEGVFPIDWLIIGSGPFKKPPIVRLSQSE